jgi:hypothetical protein
MSPDPDGRVTPPDAIVLIPDGRVTPPDGMVVPPDGMVAISDAMVAIPDGMVVPPDAMVEIPDVMVVPPDGMGPAPVLPADLVALWPLAGDGTEVSGQYPLTADEGVRFERDPLSGQAFFGPSCQEGCNGAVAPALTRVDTAAGVTLAGWVHLPGTNPHEALFGFGDIFTYPDRFVVSFDNHDLLVHLGPGNAVIRFGDLACRPLERWVHVAVTAPPGFAVGGDVRVYLDGRLVPVDGIEQAARPDCVLPPDLCDPAPEGCMAFQLSVAPTPEMATGDFARAFGIGRQTIPGGGHAALAEVALFARALTPGEVLQLVAARPAPAFLPDAGACVGFEPAPECTCAAGSVPCEL